MCDYELEPGKKCPIENYNDSLFCVLHTPFPENKKDIEYQQIMELKNRKILEKIVSGDFDFTGVIIQDFFFPEGFKIKKSINCCGAKIRGNVFLGKITISEDALFNGTTIEGATLIEGTIIGGTASFTFATIKGQANFKDAIIKGDVSFIGAKIDGMTSFNGSTIEGNALFIDAEMHQPSFFRNVTIKKCVQFDRSKTNYIWFDGTTIEESASFDGINADGDISFIGMTIGGDVTFDCATINGDARFCEDKNHKGTFKGDIYLNSTKIKRNLIFTESFLKIYNQ